jgi:hypothetical protein
MVIWPLIATFLFVGYLSMARTFAYLGVPPVFIGEIALGAFLLLKSRVVLGTWLASLMRASPLGALGLALLVFVAYGVWQDVRGILAGRDLILTLKYLAFNYYPLYLFMGMWIGLHSPDFLRRLIRITAWVNGIYGILFLAVLRHVEGYLPGTNVPLFSAPTGQTLVIIGLLCFERDLRPVWPVLVINILITLVWQVRAEWAGLAVGVLAWGVLTGRLRRVVAIGLAGVIVLGTVELAGIRLPGRSGDEVSFSENMARIVAPISLDLAKQLSPNAKYHAGTAEWREVWWEQIWISVHATPMLAAFGHGYGFDLYGLMPREFAGGPENFGTRTPHNLFYYALAYEGWVGVAIVAALQLAIGSLLWRSYRVTGQAAGLIFWLAAMVRLSFEEGLETPFKAIPYYLLWGMAMAPALRAWRPKARRAGPAAFGQRPDLRPPPRAGAAAGS